MTTLHFLKLHGREVAPFVERLGGLRLQVFGEYPYLYEGSLADEQLYLETYVRSPSSLVLLALDGASVVGATTCLRMDEAEPAFKASFEAAGFNLHQVCYFGESVLLPSHRGQGIGKKFFAERERHARDLGTDLAAFCAVDRPVDHPQRPPSYRPLDGFWQAQGYAKQPHLQATFVWKEIGEQEESPKTLTFWTKRLMEVS